MGHIFGREFVLVNRGAYIRGGFYSGFPVCSHPELIYARSLGRHPYPGDNAKRQFDVMFLTPHPPMKTSNVVTNAHLKNIDLKF